MFATHQRRHDFADTRTAPIAGASASASASASTKDSVWALSGFGRLETSDAADLTASADAADRQLMHLVVCAAAATLLLALAASIGG